MKPILILRTLCFMVSSFVFVTHAFAQGRYHDAKNGSDSKVIGLKSYKPGSGKIPALIETLEHDERLTRSVHYHRTYNTTGHLLGVREPALEALEQILRTGHLTCGIEAVPRSPCGPLSPVGVALATSVAVEQHLE